MSGPTLSTHVLDTELGQPARGVRVALFKGRSIDPMATGETNAEGRIPQLAMLEEGAYRLEFDVAGYFQAQGRETPFFARVAVELIAQASDRHYHVPLLLSPYACTTYRGS